MNPPIRAPLWDRVVDELDRAYAKHGAERWSRHEFYAILKEEVDELWDAIKSDAPPADVLDELVQVMAMCVRYVETPDRYQGWALRDALNHESPMRKIARKMESSS